MDSPPSSSGSEGGFHYNKLLKQLGILQKKKKALETKLTTLPDGDEKATAIQKGENIKHKLQVLEGMEEKMKRITSAEKERHLCETFPEISYDEDDDDHCSE
eukprot:TRINITY_DN7709_c0_g4_i1.p1 TRINITY_DN7709_c0_g4~~TRINITY_DN7709_c0_g4_i1.p1  ORF type:complete len:102 (-),score=28.69 TRINITY_DN7709_c0_g4_i1:158-463(-)